MADKRINPNAQKWIDALRSGKYAQGKFALNWGDTYCCLGVACEVAIENGVPVERYAAAGLYTAYNGDKAILPATVREWLGLMTAAEVQGSLMRMNDADGKDFPSIASALESRPDYFFEGRA